MTKEIAIKLNCLSIGYTTSNRQKIVAKDINASLYCGELVSLIGNNGAGKSTLLRTISAFEQPISGDVRYADIFDESFTASSLSKHLAIVLTQKTNLQHLTTYEVVALGRTPHTGFMGNLSSTDDAVIQESMEMVGVDNLSSRKVESLSDGEMQKVMIAKALAQQTKLILLDEPTAFLDFKSRVGLMNLLRCLARESGKAILLSTHDLELALQLSDRLWILNNSKLTEGDIEELSNNNTISSIIDCGDIYYDKKTKRIMINDKDKTDINSK